MPLHIEHVDAMARREQRDVLFLEFHPQTWSAARAYDYEADPVRCGVLQWLDGHGQAWRPCGGFADERTMWPYFGQVALDQPYDETSPAYRELSAYLENPDGTMRIAGVIFRVMPLSYAMKNAAHDAPGFWERWAENF